MQRYFQAICNKMRPVVDATPDGESVVSAVDLVMQQYIVLSSHEREKPATTHPARSYWQAKDVRNKV